MLLRIETPVSAPALDLLRHCYRFVNEEWQHLPRDGSVDQGFEVSLRESCIAKLAGWVVSQHREMNLGMGLITASGVLHEIDVVAQHEPTVGILELKNRAAWPPEKNDVIVFFRENFRLSLSHAHALAGAPSADLCVELSLSAIGLGSMPGPGHPPGRPPTPPPAHPA
jgi:hypothetical protein